MKPILYPDFVPCIQDAAEWLQHKSEVVHTQRWQGVDISKLPEMATFEVANCSFAVQMRQYDRMVHGLGQSRNNLNEDVNPNQPWAECHFQERVCGDPINPGEEWRRWPYGHSAEKFLGMTKTMAPQDWAYLAAIVDGEGSMSIRTSNGKQAYPRIKITQVDEPFIRGLFELWGVGTFRAYSAENNKLSDRQSWIWRISSKGEVRWLLEGMMPYLRLKRHRAEELMAHVDEASMPTEAIFNHNYMERYYPKIAGNASVGHRGIRYEYGDLDDVIKQLASDPLTRQAYLPVWFPEDTGGGAKRAPCTIGYHFLMRSNRLHINYHIRSCDFLRHFRDDIYLTVRLAQWVMDKCAELNPEWGDVRLGDFHMQIGSLHLFKNDYRQLFGDRG